MTPFGISTQIKYAICYQVWHPTGTTFRNELARIGTKSGATSCTNLVIDLVPNLVSDQMPNLILV